MPSLPPHSAKTIALVSPKGGTGKTTLCLSYGEMLARWGKRVLLIDSDFSTRGLSRYLNIISLQGLEREIEKMGDPKREIGLAGFFPELGLKKTRDWEVEAYCRPIALSEVFDDPKLEEVRSRLHIHRHGKLVVPNKEIARATIMREDTLIAELTDAALLEAPPGEEPEETRKRALGLFLHYWIELRTKLFTQFDFVLIDTRGGGDLTSGIAATVADLLVFVSEYEAGWKSTMEGFLETMIDIGRDVEQIDGELKRRKEKEQMIFSQIDQPKTEVVIWNRCPFRARDLDAPLPLVGKQTVPYYFAYTSAMIPLSGAVGAAQILKKSIAVDDDLVKRDIEFQFYLAKSLDYILFGGAVDGEATGYIGLIPQATAEEKAGFRTVVLDEWEKKWTEIPEEQRLEQNRVERERSEREARAAAGRTIWHRGMVTGAVCLAVASTVFIIESWLPLGSNPHVPALGGTGILALLGAAILPILAVVLLPRVILRMGFRHDEASQLRTISAVSVGMVMLAVVTFATRWSVIGGGASVRSLIEQGVEEKEQARISEKTKAAALQAQVEELKQKDAENQKVIQKIDPQNQELVKQLTTAGLVNNAELRDQVVKAAASILNRPEGDLKQPQDWERLMLQGIQTSQSSAIIHDEIFLKMLNVAPPRLSSFSRRTLAEIGTAQDDFPPSKRENLGQMAGLWFAGSFAATPVRAVSTPRPSSASPPKADALALWTFRWFRRMAEDTEAMGSKGYKPPLDFAFSKEDENLSHLLVVLAALSPIENSKGPTADTYGNVYVRFLIRRVKPASRQQLVPLIEQEMSALSGYLAAGDKEAANGQRRLAEILVGWRGRGFPAKVCAKANRSALGFCRRTWKTAKRTGN
ncbi:MAG: AAA family ATPase [Chthoniobacter sp.]